MKSLIFVALLFFVSIQVQAQYEDKTPQSAKPAEYVLWSEIINKFDYVLSDSSTNKTTRLIAKFDGIKIQYRRGTGNLSVVSALEYRNIQSDHGSLFLYIFYLNNKKEIVSLRPIDGYKKVLFLLSPHGLESQKLDGYIPNNVANKEVTRIEIKY